ncbi:MAG: hypothetical protein ACTSPM_00880 [Candidatus Heimdallarchaeota archaeon]
MTNDETEKEETKVKVEKEKVEKKDTEELTGAQKRTKRQQERAQKRRERKEKIKEKKFYHPLRILRGIGLFFWIIIKIIIFPYVYAYWKIRDTFKFLSRNDKEDLDRTLLEEEDGDTIPEGYINEVGFLRSLPMFYFIAGTLGAVIAIFISFDFMDPIWTAIKDFFVNFQWSIAWALFVDILEKIYVDLIWNTIIVNVWNWFVGVILYLFAGDRFWIPLIILIVLGVGIVILAVIFSEADFSGKFMKKVKAFFTAIFTFPKTVWGWMKSAYHGFQRGISRFTFGNDKLIHYQKRFFYRIVLYSSIITFWIIATVITLVIANAVDGNEIVNEALVYPIVLLIIGFANGVLLLAFLSWLIGLISGGKYIVNPEEYTKYKEEKIKEKDEKKSARAEKQKERISKKSG